MKRSDYILEPFHKDQEYMDQRISEGIEQNRKGNLALRVTDQNGAPLSGVHVRLKQTKHAFLHGANLFMLDEMESEAKNQSYKQRFLKAFNLATLPFYWSDLEPAPGKPRYEIGSAPCYRRPTPDLCLKFCDETGVTPKLHCLNYDQWTPVWVPQHDEKEVKRLLEKRMAEISARYADRIHGIEVINETLLNPVYDRGSRRSTDFFFADDNVTWSFDCARKYFPNNELIINEATGYAWDTDRNSRSYFSMALDNAFAGGASIDCIGLQYHLFHRLENEEKLSCPLLSPRRLYAAMDYYWQRFGKPLQVTEVTIPAYSAEAEDEEIQARLLEGLYSIWFSHPAMEAVIYWNLVDGYAAFAPQGDMTSGENYYYGGLVRFDSTPKPAYDRLLELFQHRWHTDAASATDEQGAASLRGFYGDYEVTLEKNGRSVTQTAHWDKGMGPLTLSI